MLDRLSPTRRRLVVTVLAAVAVLVVAVGVLVVVRSHGDRVTPVAQDEPGPVLLVPGYGGSTASLDPLATALRDEGRDVVVVPAPGDGTGDLRDQAAGLAQAAQAVLQRTGAPSVDVVGYSAGGIAVRYWVAHLGGGSLVRRAVTLSTPSHGTDLAALAGGVAPDACPTACQQLAPDSDLLRDLNRDETPPGPRWVALWTTDDKTVVPPTSGSLAGALDFSVQSVCPTLTVSHGDMPRTPAVIAMVAAELTSAAPAVPPASVCSAGG